MIANRQGEGEEGEAARRSVLSDVVIRKLKAKNALLEEALREKKKQVTCPKFVSVYVGRPVWWARGSFTLQI